MVQIPGVGPLQAHHPLIAAQAPGQLSVAHVHRVDLRRPVLEHAVRKASRGGPYVHTNFSL